jgi:hypothetical protein
MLDAFAEHERMRRVALHDGHNLIAMQPGTRLYRIVRLTYGWRLWLATRDFVHGSYRELHNDGTIMAYECRPDEGDEVYRIRPSDDEIRGSGSAATQ